LLHNVRKRSDCTLKIAVIGAGSWGTAMAGMLGEKHNKVWLWIRSKALSETVRQTRINEKYLPGIVLSANVSCSSDLEKVASGAAVVIVAVPSLAMREIAEKLARIVTPETIIVNAAKGFESKSLLRMSQVLKECIPVIDGKIAVISGPNHAEEVGLKYPSATVVASESRRVAETVQDIFMMPHFRVYTNPDLIGVELGGALKNIIALGAGIVEGLGLGDNTKAALMTRGITEITRLGIAMGAQPLTFSGLSGIGDLIATCTSKHSRNRRAGILLAQGKTSQEIQSETAMVIEGIRATWATFQLASKYKIEMPIAEQMFLVLYKDKSPQNALFDLMMRGRTDEVEEIVVDKLTWKNQ
jgi:glycerol-3-phosphate dehydrogenase (NAD(P)+)